MSDANAAAAWVERYRRAWESNDAADIGALFTDDARYFTEPYNEPWVGRDAIVEGWLAERDEPGDTEFEFDVIAVSGDLAFVQGTTRYLSSPRTYSNLWVVRLADDGRAREFTEWWMKHR
jgi:uncharacterized protein (TIGR02246 family)